MSSTERRAGQKDAGQNAEEEITGRGEQGQERTAILGVTIAVISESNNPTVSPKTPGRKLGKSCSQHRALEDTSHGIDPFPTLQGTRGISRAPPEEDYHRLLAGSSHRDPQEELDFQLVLHHSAGQLVLFSLVRAKALPEGLGGIKLAPPLPKAFPVRPHEPLLRSTEVP